MKKPALLALCLAWLLWSCGDDAKDAAGDTSPNNASNNANSVNNSPNNQNNSANSDDNSANSDDNSDDNSANSDDNNLNNNSNNPNNSDEPDADEPDAEQDADEPDADGPDPALDGLTRAVAEEVCGALWRCCSQEDVAAYFEPLRAHPRLEDLADGLPPSEAECPARLAEALDIVPLGPWVEAVKRGLAEFNPDEARACLEELRGAACGRPLGDVLFDSTCWGFQAPIGGEQQRRAFTRVAVEGEACIALSDGVGGVFFGSCDPNQGFCCVPGPDGECVVGAPLSEGTCASASAEGEACSFPPVQVCQTGLDCSDEGRCVALETGPLQVGERCAENFFLTGECQGSWCDLLGTERCEPLKALGAACGGAFECGSGVCDAGVCAQWSYCSVGVEQPDAGDEDAGDEDAGDEDADAAEPDVPGPDEEPGVTTLAGTGAPGASDGPALGGASFFEPSGLAFDPQGNLWIADRGNRSVRKLDPNGQVSTLPLSGGALVGPWGIVVNPAGDLLVSDADDHCIRRINTLGAVTTFAGQCGQRGSTDATGTGARFNRPRGLALQGDTLLVADSNNYLVRQITPQGAVSTLAGSPELAGFTDSALPGALYFVWGIAADSERVYVAGQDNCVRLIEDGQLSRAAGQCANFGNAGEQDGPAADARFEWPRGLALGPDGALYIADTSNHRIRRLTTDGQVETVAGQGEGSTDGTLEQATFSQPVGLTFGPDGALYVSEIGSHKVRRLVLE
jgi:hypothetical protein